MPDVRLMGEWQGAGCAAAISLLIRAKIHRKQTSSGFKAKAIFLSFSFLQEQVYDQTAIISCIRGIHFSRLNY